MPQGRGQSAHTQRPTVAALFAGIGGLELGCAAAGRKATLLCEIEPKAQAVLSDRFPGVPIHADVAKLKASDLPRSVDTITAGFPCQDLSQAGQTKGLRKGKKSSLVSHVFRLARSPRIRHLILENVPFMLKLDSGAAMRSLVRRLNTAGFGWAYRVLDSRAFGLPQRRQRVFFVASRDFDPSLRLFHDDYGIPERLERPGNFTGFYWTEGNTGIGWAENGIPPLKVGSTMSIPSPPAIWRRENDDIVTPSIRDAEALQGFPRGWTDAATAGQSDRYRWRLVGNAVSVNAAEWAAQSLKRRNRAPIGPIFQFAQTSGWPSAAFGGSGRKAQGVDVSAFPSYQAASLGGFVRSPRPLSERATDGFRSRYLRSKLKKRDEFIAALTDHLEWMRSEMVTG